jgi:hypothetical protein
VETSGTFFWSIFLKDFLLPDWETRFHAVRKGLTEFNGYYRLCLRAALLYVDIPLSFTTCFGLRGHLQVCRSLHIFIFVYLRSLLRCLFLCGYTACFSFVFCSCAVFIRVFCVFLLMLLSFALYCGCSTVRSCSTTGGLVVYVT